VRIDPDGNGAVVAVPVLADPATRAVLTVATPAPHGLARSDVEMLGAVGGFVGAALAGVQSLVTATDELLRDERRGEELKLFVTGALGPAVERHVQGVLAAEEIRRVVNDAQLHMHFQPIAELESGLVVGYEALARFDVEPIRSPEAWFSSASDVGLGVDLELAAIEAAIRQLPRIPAGRFLSLNVSPATAETGELLDLCLAEGVDPARLVVEVTEHAPVDDYGRLCASLDALRERGARLAIDDAGAGFASLRHVLRLHPEMIKLDVSLTRNIDTDPVRRALASSLISFAQEVDATIVAEGIETRWEAEALTALGVRYGQGFHLARPGALVDLPLDVPEEPPAAS
jgi:EAL domain-containing protein (putative c-di-GMP-specific phosphodiesterase class I)